MKLLIRQVHHEISRSFAALIHREIKSLEPLLVIEEARISIERRFESSPGFYVGILLVTPGPDIHVEACDHTVHAAMRKTVDRLHDKIRERGERRAERIRSNRQEPATRLPPALALGSRW